LAVREIVVRRFDLLAHGAAAQLRTDEFWRSVGLATLLAAGFEALSKLALGEIALGLALVAVGAVARILVCEICCCAVARTAVGDRDGSVVVLLRVVFVALFLWLLLFSLPSHGRSSNGSNCSSASVCRYVVNWPCRECSLRPATKEVLLRLSFLLGAVRCLFLSPAAKRGDQ